MWHRLVGWLVGSLVGWLVTYTPGQPVSPIFDSHVVQDKCQEQVGV